LATCASTARSISASPSGVSATSVPLLSAGLGRRATRPAFSSRSIRLVMLPEEIIAAS
jgi:hypothetical protein